MRISLLNEVDSTNTFLHSLLQKEEVEEGRVVLANKQTHGKGQRGNSWFSSAGKNLTFSLLLRPSQWKPSWNFLLSQCIAVSIVEAFSVYASNFSIKWPNDIYWKDKKLGGILIENSFKGNIWDCSIIGIGLNILENNFPKELPNPVSLWQISPKEYNLGEVLNELLKVLMNNYHNVLKVGMEEIQEKYLKLLYKKDVLSEYEAEGKRFLGTIRGIEPFSGKLCIEKMNGEIKRFDFKEVQFILQPNNK